MCSLDSYLLCTCYVLTVYLLCAHCLLTIYLLCTEHEPDLLLIAADSGREKFDWMHAIGEVCLAYVRLRVRV